MFYPNSGALKSDKGMSHPKRQKGLFRVATESGTAWFSVQTTG